MRNARERVSNGEQPAPFIVGCPRSGTTLLRLMLDAHPLVSIPLETHFIRELLRIDIATAGLRARVFRLVVGSPRWHDFHLNNEEFRRRLEAVDPFTIRAGLRTFYAMCAERRGKPRWGDKTPRYGEHMVAISTLLPEAHFIHVIRDARDVACSLRTMWWEPGGDVTKHASQWRDRVIECRRQGRLVPNYLEIRYEDMVGEPATTLLKICKFIAVPYDANMLEYHRSAGQRMAELGDLIRADGTVVGLRDERLSIHQRTQLPPNRDRIGRWRTELTDPEIVAIEHAAGPLMTELGYELSNSSFAQHR